MDLITSPEAAARAAKQILGYYPTIPASDPKAFAAGLVKVLSNYPPAVVAQAVDPGMGIPALVDFLNLAKINKLLENWRDEYFERLDRQERADRLKIAAPIFVHPTPDAEQRIAVEFDKLVARLKSGIVA